MWENWVKLCFLWYILAHLHPVEDHKNRTSKYVMHMPTLCVEGLEFPVKVRDLPKFERMNNFNGNVSELNKKQFSHQCTLMKITYKHK